MRAREVDVVVAYSVDRLTRSAADLERVFSAAEEHSVRIEGTRDLAREPHPPA